MSEPIGPGDWVECVGRAANKPYCNLAAYSGPPIVLGGLYRVREIVRGRYADGSEDDGLRLSGIRGYGRDGREGAWPTAMFRPIYRPKASLIQSLLKPIEADPAKEAAQ